MIRRPLLWILTGWILGELLAAWLGLVEVPASSYYASEETDVSLAFLEQGKAFLKESLRRLSADDEEEGIFTALLLGDRRSLPEDTYSLFQNGGIAHIIAISGLHLSLIAGAVSKLLRRLGLSKKTAALISSLLLLFYVLMIGGAVSAWRAFIMYAVQVGALLTKRTYDAPSALGLAGLLILLKDPLYLFNAAFQLSFGAVWALSVAAPVLVKWLRAEKNGPAKALIGSAAVQLVTFPLVAWHFYKLPLYGLFLNLLVVPLTGAALASVFAAALAALVYVPGGVFLCGLAHYIFLGIRWLCSRAEQLPGSVFVTGQPKGWQLVLYVVVMGGGLVLVKWWGKRGEEQDKERLTGRAGLLPQKMAHGLAGWLALLIMRLRGEEAQKKEERLTEEMAGLFPGRVAYGLDAEVASLKERLKGEEAQYAQERLTGKVPGPPDKEPLSERSGSQFVQPGSRFLRRAPHALRWLLLVAALALAPLLLHRPPRQDLAITMLDVGQGDCFLLELPGGGAILIDGGSSSVQDVGDRVILPALWQRALTQVHAVILSHPDADHINGIGAVLEDRTVSVGLLAASRVSRENEEYALLSEQAAQAGTAWNWLATGDVLQAGDLKLTVWFEGIATGDTNSESLILYMEAPGISALFTGDMEAAEEAAVQDWPDVDVVKVPHHGSKNSGSEAFYAQTTPALALISAGKNNLYGHPHVEVLEWLEAAGVEVHCTAWEGTVTVVVGE